MNLLQKEEEKRKGKKERKKRKIETSIRRPAKIGKPKRARLKYNFFFFFILYI